MVQHGLLVKDEQTDKEKTWRLRHLTFMVMLAKETHPDLAVDDSLNPRDIFLALSELFYLNDSVLLNLEELLCVLRNGETGPIPSNDESYADRLREAIDDAKEIYPWRIGAPRHKSKREFLFSRAPIIYLKPQTTFEWSAVPTVLDAMPVT